MGPRVLADSREPPELDDEDGTIVDDRSIEELLADDPVPLPPQAPQEAFEAKDPTSPGQKVPANPFGELSDAALRQFVECTLYEDRWGPADTSPSVPLPPVTGDVTSPSLTPAPMRVVPQVTAPVSVPLTDRTGASTKRWLIASTAFVVAVGMASAAYVVGRRSGPAPTGVVASVPATGATAVPTPAAVAPAAATPAPTAAAAPARALAPTPEPTPASPPAATADPPAPVAALAPAPAPAAAEVSPPGATVVTTGPTAGAGARRVPSGVLLRSTEGKSRVAPEERRCLARVRSSPSRAAVVWGGKRLGKTPLRDVEVPCGPADVVVSSPRREPAKMRVEASPEEPTSMNIVLETAARVRRRRVSAPPAVDPAPAAKTEDEVATPAPGPPSAPPQATVTIDSDPPGAVVRLDGAMLGTTPLKLKLEPDTDGYLTISKPGHKPWTSRLQVRSKSHVRAHLEPL